MENFKLHIHKHQNLYSFIGLTIIFYFIFFHNNWLYMLMDVDESRYVSMSKDMWNTKDFLTLYLNKEFFFEKPPVYFWLECLSFGLFGKISEATARFPVAMLGTLTSYWVYFLGKKIVSRTYGLISSLILATSLEFVILAKFAILDIVLASMVTFSVGFGILTLYVKNNNQKFCWWAFYLFSGLAVLAKGIPGFIIPFGSIFFIYLYKNRVKELFKPIFLLPGIIIFLLVVLPWHIIMIKLHGQLFIDEYIIKHHLSRFLGSDEIGRQQPFYYYLITLSWGFFPWIISFIAVICRKLSLKDVTYKNLNQIQSFLMLNAIIVVFILTFFSASSTKLVTYILPIYPYLAFLGGYIWLNYIEKGAYKNIINKTVYFVGFIFILASLIAIFCSAFLPAQLYQDLKSMQIFTILLLFMTGILSIIFAKREKHILVFFTYILFMTVLASSGTHRAFELDYKFGQNDLKEFSDYANTNNKSVICYGFDRKYSVLYYTQKPVKYLLNYTILDIKNGLNDKDSVIILKNKDINDDIKKINYKTIAIGRKYTLIEQNKN